MTIFIGADHRGFHLKDLLISYLQEKNIRVEDMGNYSYDPHDDFPQYAQKVSEAVLQNPEEFLGVVICGSGVGVSIAANRYPGVYCALGSNPDQVKSAREHDHINILALPADYISQEDAQKLVDIFLSTQTKNEAKYLRRIQSLERKTHSANQ